MYWLMRNIGDEALGLLYLPNPPEFRAFVGNRMLDNNNDPNVLHNQATWRIKLATFRHRDTGKTVDGITLDERIEERNPLTMKKYWKVRYYGTELSKTEYESYLEMELFPPLAADWAMRILTGKTRP